MEIRLLEKLYDELEERLEKDETGEAEEEFKLCSEMLDKRIEGLVGNEIDEFDYLNTFYELDENERINSMFHEASEENMKDLDKYIEESRLI